MKSAVSSGKGGSAGGLPPLSHIPLPRRKSSSKGEIELSDSELGVDYLVTRSQAKPPLLSSSSFCCTSGQKEDYDVRIVPRKKLSAPNSRQIHETSAPNSPLVPPQKALLRNRKKIIDNPSEDTISQTSELGLRKPSQEDIKFRPVGDSRLRPPDQRVKNTPSSPHRKLSRDPLPFQKEILESKKVPELVKKGRKYSSPLFPSKEIRNHKKSKEESETVDKRDQKVSDHASKSSKMSSPKSTHCEVHAIAPKSPADAFHPANNMFDCNDVKTLPDKSCHTTGMFAMQHARKPMGIDSVNSRGNNTIDFHPSAGAPREPMDSTFTGDHTVDNYHNSDEFDCPCCDRTPTFVGGLMPDLENHVFGSCEVGSSTSGVNKSDALESTEKERSLELQVQSLQEDLESGRLQLKSQMDRVLCLEEELAMMKQLEVELQKEKELRKIAEDKLLEVLDHEKEREAIRKENEKQMESRGTQKDDTDIGTTEENSPLVMGYESRVRRYQSYITKLEKDNLSLINELKKFKDTSPVSQESQARILLEKLSEIQRSSHQQQLQYESCLDEVANRLVHTLLVQKRLEEECKVLHLRVEQLEQENGTLMELFHDDRDEIRDDATKSEEGKIATTKNKVQIKQPSHHSTTPLSPTKKPFHLAEATESANVFVEPANSSTSPVSPSKLGSKIPAFNSCKTGTDRKKSRTEVQLAKVRNEHLLKETNMKSSTPRTKMAANNSENSKGPSVKRKRLSRNSSPAEKDSKHRLKNGHSRWEQRRTVPGDLTSFCKPTNGEISPIDAFNRQQIWSFNCEMNREVALPESFRKIADSVTELSGKNSIALSDIDKQNFESDISTTIDGASKTRDEGYSTMSSDLQPDSVADTIVSEPEHSVTHIGTGKELRSVSEDSITECLDSSMCSSSDSGFGPLHLVANSKSDFLEKQREYVKEPTQVAQEIPRNICTVRHKDQIASVKPTVRSKPSTFNELLDKPNPISSNFKNFDSDSVSIFKTPSEEYPLSALKARSILQQLDNSLQMSTLRKPKFDYTSMLDYWSCTPDIMDITKHSNTWRVSSKISNIEDKLDFCSRHSYIDDNIFDEKVQTAEKSTLTEPEEEMWRENTLAPYIDESIWSLYSSEGDVRVKHFPLEPLLSQPSLDNLILQCNPCIVITEDINLNSQTDLPDCMTLPKPTKSSNDSKIAALGDHHFKNGLERVASDTVLYLKDAIHELEDSMHRGLKTSKNLSSLHNSGSESETSPCSFKTELLVNLEKIMTEQQKNLIWPPSKSSSTSSLQSASSCQAISDGTDDYLDLSRTSGKESQGHDLSASDQESESIEHKEFVERWVQSEIAEKGLKMVHPFEPVNEATTSVRRKTSVPSIRPNVISRPRFMSYPQTSKPSLLKIHPVRASPVASASCDPNCLTSCSLDEGDFRGVDDEVKGFNGDFYKLCSVDSNKSLDQSLLAKLQDTQSRLLAESPSSNATNSPKKSKRQKPTGLVKPTRPITLVVNRIPEVSEHCKSKKLYFQNSKSVVSYPEQKPKLSQVPPNNHKLQNKISLPTSLPVPAQTQNEPETKSKVSSPIKKPTKCSSSSKRQQNKKDAANERRGRLKEGCGTAWIHLQANPQLNDPVNRLSLLESIKPSPTSSSGSSSEDDDSGDVLVIQTASHLQRICQERRHKVKASAQGPLCDGKRRSSIVGRRELFYRFGDKEREAIACFDFLEEHPVSSIDNLSVRSAPSPVTEVSPIQCTLTPSSSFQHRLFSRKVRNSLSPTVPSKLASFADEASSATSFRKSNLWNIPPWSHSESCSTLSSHDCEFLDHVSLSDSCAESYSSTPDSHEETVS